MRMPGHGTLRAKFLLSLALITTALTAAVLLVVGYSVQVHVRTDIAQALDTSVSTFQTVQQQRESTLARSAALVATLPPLKSVLTSGDRATIQDASRMFWDLSGSQLFVLADRTGRLMALHELTPGFPPDHVQAGLARYVDTGVSSEWWFGDGRLYQVFLRPIYFGSLAEGELLGILGLGYEIDEDGAESLSRVAGSDVAFGYERELVIGTIAGEGRRAVAEYVRGLGDTAAEPRELLIGDERYLATSVRLSAPELPLVSLTALKSLDQAAAYLHSVNQRILGIGVVAVAAGALLVFIVSTSFTRPLARLVSGVQALDRGDFKYPLVPHGSDEVSALTGAFVGMRSRLQETQRRLLDAEQLATIGRMSSTISHDLRHPLTAIQAYAEFLADRNLTDAQRQDYYEEIRAAVNRMMDEINALLAFSRQGEALTLVEADAAEVIDRAVRTMTALPEFEKIKVKSSHGQPCVARFDPAKLERVLLNLLVNAAEALAPGPGRIDVSCSTHEGRLDIRVTDNGPGIAPEIRDKLFQPFVTFGKENGIGLGLTVVQSIVQQHGGEVSVEQLNSGGTTFRISLPADASAVSEPRSTTAPA